MHRLRSTVPPLLLLALALSFGGCSTIYREKIYSPGKSHYKKPPEKAAAPADLLPPAGPGADALLLPPAPAGAAPAPAADGAAPAVPGMDAMPAVPGLPQ
jgi:hypothetical protein